MKKNCDNCFWAFPYAGDLVCANHFDDNDDTYGELTSNLLKRFPDSCPGWEITFESFCDNFDSKHK